MSTVTFTPYGSWAPRAVHAGVTVVAFSKDVGELTAAELAYICKLPHGSRILDGLIYKQVATAVLDVGLYQYDGSAVDDDIFISSVSATGVHRFFGSVDNLPGVAHRISVSDDQIERYQILVLQSSSATYSGTVAGWISYAVDQPGDSPA